MGIRQDMEALGTIVKNKPVLAVIVGVYTTIVGALFLWFISLIFVVVAGDMYTVKERQGPAQCIVSRAAVIEFLRPRYEKGREVQWIDLKCPTNKYWHLQFEKTWMLKKQLPRYAWDALNAGDHVMCTPEKITSPEWVHALKLFLAIGNMLPADEKQNPRFIYSQCTLTNKG